MPRLSPRIALALSIATVILFAIAGAVLAGGNPGGWYEALRKPAWLVGLPVFYAVAVVYSFIAAALLYRTLTHDGPAITRAAVLVLVLAVLVANELWNYLFLGRESVTLGALGMVGFGLLVAALMAMLLRHRWHREALILAPYAAWVVYDVAWALELWRLNA